MRSKTNDTCAARPILGQRLSSSISAQRDVDSGDYLSSVLCCLPDLSLTKVTVHEDVVFNGVQAVTTLIHPGATDCFITVKVAQQFGLNVTK